LGTATPIQTEVSELWDLMRILNAGADFVLPVHHQTFQLSNEPYREPIERFVTALSGSPERVALTAIGQEFHFRR